MRTRLGDVGRATLRFEYEIFRGEGLITSGHTKHGCIRLADGKAVRIPDDLSSAFED